VNPGSVPRRVEIVRFLADRGAAPRVALSGGSMEPTLSHGRVLELAPYVRERTRIGDILVFRDGARLVAHRILAFTSGGIRTCGDAQPWTTELVTPDAIVGIVSAVYESERAAAPCASRRELTARGACLARLAPLRALPHRGRDALWRAKRALPWRRTRLFEALVGVACGFVRGRGELVAVAVDSVDPQALAAYARRHTCGALLRSALELDRGAPQADALRAELRLDSLRIAVRAIALREQIVAVVRALQAQRVPFALLKGAARIYSGTSDAVAHPSNDIDVLVPRARQQFAVEALRAQGYHFRLSPERERRYRATHHHAAPLYPPNGSGWFVEVHVELAPPGSLSIRSDWEALWGHLVEIDGPAGPVRAFDDFASALHQAIHGIALDRLRDVAICAQGLSKLDPAALEELRALARAECVDPVRLRAVLSLAARLAGVTWPEDADARTYLRWVARRENMPEPLATRAHSIEAWFAAGRRPARLNPRILTHGQATWRRAAGRVALAPLVLAYAALMDP
jgi:hypothetical protein